MRPLPSLKAPKFPEHKIQAPLIAGLFIAAELCQALLPEGAVSGWVFAAVRLVLLGWLCLWAVDAAGRDGLTGALGYAAYAQRQRRGFPDGRICVIFVDVDGLKLTNDRCGHEQGDHLLRELAVALRGQMHCRDRLYRVGGDEFVLVLRNREAPEDFLHGLPVSCGSASGPGSCFAALVSRADEAMYRNKNAKKP